MTIAQATASTDCLSHQLLSRQLHCSHCYYSAIAYLSLRRSSLLLLGLLAVYVGY